MLVSCGYPVQIIYGIVNKFVGILSRLESLLSSNPSIAHVDRPYEIAATIKFCVLYWPWIWIGLAITGIAFKGDNNDVTDCLIFVDNHPLDCKNPIVDGKALM